MKKVVKKKWVEALRSGEYEQGTGALCADGKHCCLGVLCDVAAKEDVVDLDASDPASVKYGGRSVLPPRVVSDWAGLPASDPTLTYWDGDMKLISYLNDWCNVNFEELSDLIEENL